MNRYQKLAWWNLIVIAATIIITTTAIIIELKIRGYSIIGPGFIAIMILLKFNPFLFKRPKSAGGVVSDERDTLIVKRAVSFAYIAFWIVFIASSFAVYILMGMEPGSSIPTITLPLIALGGAVFMKILCSVAMLVQYNRGGKSNE
jgi:hypothetical protein